VVLCCEKILQFDTQVMRRFSVSPDMLPYVIAVDTFGTQVANAKLSAPRVPLACYILSSPSSPAPGIGIRHITRLAMNPHTFCF
jgi:hypothetical protein